MNKKAKELNCIKQNANNVGAPSAFAYSNKNGITLIALVITIIVMLILVGVTVNIAINGGLFGMARTASEETTHAQVREIISTELAQYEIKKTIGQTNETAVTWLGEKGYLVGYNSEEELQESYVVEYDKIKGLSLGKGTKEKRRCICSRKRKYKNSKYSKSSIKYKC